MSDGESEGEDLQEGCHRDYAAVGVLDSYEPDMLDDGAHSALSHSARRRAEEAMSARDMMARARAQAMSSASGRAPKALQQVSANREALVVVATLCGKVKAQNDVQTKACEYLRRAYIGLRCLSGVSQAALPAACIEIASKQCKRPIAREALLRRAGVREQDFIRTLSSLHLLLKIRRQVTVNEACAEFKCNAIKGEVRHTLEVFKRQFWANLPAEKREAADFGRPVFPLVSLLLTAERHKLLVKIPARCWQSQGAALHARLAEEFSRVYEQMKWLCTPAAMAGAQLQLPQAKAAQELSEPAAAPAEPVPATFNEFVVGAASTVDGYVLGRAEAAEAAEAEAGAEEAPVFGARPQAPALSEDGGCAARVPASELLSAAQSAAAGAAQVAPLGTPEFETPERITRADSGCIDSDVERSARQTEKATKVSRVFAGKRPLASAAQRLSKLAKAPRLSDGVRGIGCFGPDGAAKVAPGAKASAAASGLLPASAALAEPRSAFPRASGPRPQTAPRDSSTCPAQKPATDEPAKEDRFPSHGGFRLGDRSAEQPTRLFPIFSTTACAQGQAVNTGSAEKQ